MWKKCSNCRLVFNRRNYPNMTNQRWLAKKYCSKKCLLTRQAWNKGLTGWMSEEGKKKVAQNLVNFRGTESKEDASIRMTKAAKTRIANGWRPASETTIGKDSSFWKGEDASYNAKHRWIQKHWTKTDICINCNNHVLPRPETRLKHATHWANISGQYKRERNDWLELCPKCHVAFDKK